MNKSQNPKIYNEMSKQSMRTAKTTTAAIWMRQKNVGKNVDRFRLVINLQQLLLLWFINQIENKRIQVEKTTKNKLATKQTAKIIIETMWANAVTRIR